MSTTSQFGYIRPVASEVTPQRTNTDVEVVAYAASTTLTANTFQGSIDNTGAGSPTVLTLPAVSTVKGKTARFIRIVGQNMTLTAPSAILVFGARAYTSVVLNTLNQTVDIYCDGTYFYVTNVMAPGSLS